LAAGAAGYFIFFLQGGAGYNLKIISGSAVNKQLSLSERREFSLSERHRTGSPIHIQNIRPHYN
jgi:hypothetical protein